MWWQYFIAGIIGGLLLLWLDKNAFKWAVIFGLVALGTILIWS